MRRVMVNSKTSTALQDNLIKEATTILATTLISLRMFPMVEETKHQLKVMSIDYMVMIRHHSQAKSVWNLFTIEAYCLIQTTKSQLTKLLTRCN